MKVQEFYSIINDQFELEKWNVIYPLPSLILAKLVASEDVVTRELPEISTIMQKPDRSLMIMHHDGTDTKLVTINALTGQALLYSYNDEGSYHTPKSLQ